MADFKIKAQIRTELGKMAQLVRESDMIPAVVYGGKENFNIKVGRNDFDKLHAGAGESNIIDLEIEGGSSLPVLIQDIQRHPTTHVFSHADFFEVDMKNEITANVSLNFIGESAAVKALGGILLKNLEEVEIKCLPGDLIHEITVDITALNTFEDSIHVSDLEIPENVEFVTGEQVLVVKVAEPREEVEEEEEISEEDAVAAVAGEEKPEGEDGSEGGEKKEEAPAKEESKE